MTTYIQALEAVAMHARQAWNTDSIGDMALLGEALIALDATPRPTVEEVARVMCDNAEGFGAWDENEPEWSKRVYRGNACAVLLHLGLIGEGE